MRQSRYNPTMVEGEVNVTCFPDPVLLSEKTDNDRMNRPGCYPGGSNPNNNIVSVGELVVARRTSNDPYDAQYINVINTANGINYDEYGSQDALERDFTPIGFAKTMYRPDDPDQPQHGFPVYVAGKITIDSNNSGVDIMAGDELEWAFPPQSESITSRNRPGPLHKQTMIVKPVDYTDYNIHLAGFFARFISGKNAPKAKGIQGIPLKVVLQPGKYVHKLNNAQEQDAKLYYGKVTEILAAIEYLTQVGLLDYGTGLEARDNIAVDLADKLGVYEDGREIPSNELRGMFAAMMWPELPFGVDRKGAESKFSQVHGGNARTDIHRDRATTAEKYAHARLHCASLTAQGYTLMAHHKRNKRIGRALSSTATGESMDVLVRR